MERKRRVGQDMLQTGHEGMDRIQKYGRHMENRFLLGTFINECPKNVSTRYCIFQSASYYKQIKTKKFSKEKERFI